MSEGSAERLVNQRFEDVEGRAVLREDILKKTMPPEVRADRLEDIAVVVIGAEERECPEYAYVAGDGEHARDCEIRRAPR